MAKNKQGPQIYGEKNNIRLEEFFEGSIMEPKNMRKPEYYKRVAKKLAGFHL